MLKVSKKTNEYLEINRLVREVWEETLLYCGSIDKLADNFRDELYQLLINPDERFFNQDEIWWLIRVYFPLDALDEIAGILTKLAGILSDYFFDSLNKHYFDIYEV